MSGLQGDDQSSDRARRESHNAVERRRREAINQGINDLADLLQQSGVVQIQQKMNKGTILAKAVEYIGFLQSVNQQMAEKMKDQTSQQAEELQKLAQELTELAADNEQLKLRVALRHQGASAILVHPTMGQQQGGGGARKSVDGMEEQSRNLKRPSDPEQLPKGRKRKSSDEEEQLAAQ